ncbi:hypothetical protein KFZ56_04475 [Virgibacillus sp. NKC19-3]|uniref:hypothetical protein n=1 Tax=Virgibacillus saliphilus TaxID=2831674 RepID=UPI001C9B7E5E|nr:hypothetical protein [Virgibacillus sp. NKC19-3]MBY7142361.1 hypothetical protein [Virgibacillus sp. NKC19-3]
MRNIFLGSFSQVEDAVSESFAKNSIDTIEKFSFGKAFLALSFGLGVFYAIYGFGIFMGNNMDTGTIVLDMNNEYIPFLSNIWFAIIPGILILITIFGGGYYRKKNNVKAFFIYNTFLTMYLLPFLLWTFKVAQLFVYFFPLRMVYTVLFSLCITYVFIRSYKNAKEMVFGEKKKRSAIVEWFSRNRKSVLSVLAAIGGLYFLVKTIFPSAGDMETRLMGALIDFAPLFVCLIFLLFLYLNNVVIRSYYLNKYTEEFRLKFGIDKSEWYGKKYF